MSMRSNVPRAIPNTGGIPSSSSSGFQLAGKDNPNSCKNRFPPGSVAMWILNFGIIAASLIALNNWMTITWMTGSTGWAAILEVVALLFLLYLLMAGCCLLGWQNRLKASIQFIVDSPQCLYSSFLAIPFLILSFFLVLTILCLAKLEATNLYVAAHAEAVFQRADGDSDNLLTFGEFREYICSLPSFQATCDDPQYREDFYAQLRRVFDSMGGYKEESITMREVYEGVLGALRPYKLRFGYSVMAICIICFLQFGYFWFMYRRESKKLPAGGAQQQAAAQEAI